MKKSNGRGATKGLTLDNVEDNIVALRDASAPTRNSKKLRDAARLKSSGKNVRSKSSTQLHGLPTNNWSHKNARSATDSD